MCNGKIIVFLITRDYIARHCKFTCSHIPALQDISEETPLMGFHFKKDTIYRGVKTTIYVPKFDSGKIINLQPGVS